MTFNKSQKDTLIYIFVERDYLIKQDSINKHLIQALEVSKETLESEIGERLRIAREADANFKKCKSNTEVLQGNLISVTKQRDRRTKIGIAIAVVLGVVAIAK